MTEAKSTPFLSPTLLSITWPFVVGFLILILIGVVSLEILMAARSFSYGENLWAKNQKSATFQLLRYAQTGNPQALERYDATMRIHQHFRKGHRATTSTPFPKRIVLDEFSAAGMPQPDIEKAAWLYQNFRNTDTIQKILRLWSEGEALMTRLKPLRAELVDYYQQNRDDPKTLTGIAAQIDEIDRLLEPREFEFSSTLGGITYRVYWWLLTIEVMLGFILLIIIVWRTLHLLQERHHIEQTLVSERKWAAVTLASIREAVISTNEQGHIIYMNPAAKRLIQAITPDLERKIRDQPPPLSNLLRLVENDTGVEKQPLTNELLDGQVDGLQSNTDHLLVRPDGSSVSVSWTASPIRDNGQMQGAVLVLHDTTREQQLIDRLSWLAAYDPLTQLPNRREFETRLSQALDLLRQRSGPSGLRREDDQQHVLMFIDLDQFKIINDTCGHAAGDEMLRQVTSAMSQHVRDQDTLARMGGDEFALLLMNCPPENGEQKAEELRRAINAVVLNWGPLRFTTSASIGLVQLRDPNVNLSTALSAADMACYKAKDNGRNRVEVYSPNDKHLMARFGEMAWSQRLQSALKEDRFCLYAQPILNLQNATALEKHWEILVRLRDEEGKLIPPESFMPAAERFGMMAMIDRWVIDHAFASIADQRKTGLCSPHTVFSINLSGSSLDDREFLSELKQLFNRYQVSYHQICFEIMETQAVINLPQASYFIKELRALGCLFALDNFGAGMSSLTYLKHIPVNFLKIDGKLVKDMLNNSTDHAIVRMINQLGHVIQIKTVGECAESPEIVEALRQNGLDYAQGFAIGHPQLWLRA